MELSIFARFLNKLPKNDADGIDLFAGGASSYPDSRCLPFLLWIKEDFPENFLERIESLRISKEIRDLNSQFSEQQLYFFRIPCQIGRILRFIL